MIASMAKLYDVNFLKAAYQKVNCQIDVAANINNIHSQKSFSSFRRSLLFCPGFPKQAIPSVSPDRTNRFFFPVDPHP
jgi:hypothetical protein